MVELYSVIFIIYFVNIIYMPKPLSKLTGHCVGLKNMV